MGKISFSTKVTITTVVVGFLVGMISTSSFDKTQLGSDFSLIKEDIPRVTIFFNTFCYQYWLFFLIWLLGLISLGFILIYFITFYKSLLYGAILGVILKTNAIIGFFTYLSKYFLEILIILPLLIYISSRSSQRALGIKQINYHKPDNYLNQLFIITLIIIIFAIIKVFI